MVVVVAEEESVVVVVVGFSVEVIFTSEKNTQMRNACTRPLREEEVPQC